MQARMRKPVGKLTGLSVVAVLLVAAAAPAFGQEDLAKKLQEMQGQLAELKAKVDELTQKKVSQEEVLKLMEKWNADAAKRGANLPKWAENLKFSGDLRLRAQSDSYNWSDTATGDHRKPRNRARFRLRFGVTKTWLDDQLEVGFRLASGEDNDPTATNQSFTGDFSKKLIWIDQAYARYSPNWLKGLSITGGKMQNPMLLNEVFLDDDVNPEGVWAEYKVPGLGPVEPFAGAGYFILNEIGQSTVVSPAHDTDLTAYQAGVAWKIVEDLKYTFAALYLDYDHYDLSGLPTRGNDTLRNIPNFAVFDLSNKVDFKVLNVPTCLFFDWAHNCEDTDSTPKFTDEDDAYATGARVGQNKKQGDWSCKYLFAHVQANSLPGYFVDGDFGNANRKGHVWHAVYNLTDDLTAGLRIIYTSPIHSAATTTNGRLTEDTTLSIRAEMIWKF